MSTQRGEERKLARRGRDPGQTKTVERRQIEIWDLQIAWLLL
jgi:hypothetical protein